MKVSLVVVKGKPEGLEIPLKVPRFIVGREKGCQLRPGSDLVSKQHCAFQLTSKTLSILDLGSTNGTYVNGERIDAEVPLNDGDMVKVGPLTFAVRMVSEKSALPASQKGKPGSAEDDLFDDWMMDAAPAPEPGGSTIMDMRALSLDDTLSEAPPESKPKTDSGLRDVRADLKYVPPAPSSTPPTASKPQQESKPADTKSDSSKAASDLLQRMMDRRRNG